MNPFLDWIAFWAWQVSWTYAFTYRRYFGKRKGGFMGLLYASELIDSSEWVDQNAQYILDSVKNAGGWRKVFPKGPPKWLHKLRNYFNVEPKCLRLVDKHPTDHAMRLIRSHGHIDGLISQFALTGDVYFDEEVETWYQMGPGGTIYHWGGHPTFAPLDAFHTQFFRGQEGIPVFKLICPDGTEGSKETIITNPKVRRVFVGTSVFGMEYEMQGAAKIGATNKNVLVIDRVDTKMETQGSYNFAETSVVGLDCHEKYDVDTHKKDPVYIDPPDRFEPLKDRFFFDYVILRAGGSLPKKSAPKSAKEIYEDDIREDPVIPKRK
jgi:hypothetical protein